MAVNKCRICDHKKLDAIETAIIRGTSPVTVCHSFGCKAGPLNSHIRLCMLPRLADRVAVLDGGSALPALRMAIPMDDDDHIEWLSLPSVASDLRAALLRLEGVANRAASKGSLGVELQAVNTTLRGLEQRARLGGLERSTGKAAGAGFSLTINIGNGVAPVTINTVAEPADDLAASGSENFLVSESHA
jgi:hypothetical protein